MHEAKEDVLAFRHFPKDHWRKIWSTNLLQRVNTKQPLGQRQLRLSLLVEDGELVVVEDQLMFLELLVGMLRSINGLEVVATATTAAAGIRACRELLPGLLILDLGLPDQDGIAVAEALAAVNPRARVIVLSAAASSFVCDPALDPMLHAVVDKVDACETLATEIAELLGPSPEASARLTEREEQVLLLIGQGLPNRRIAEQLGLSVHTIDTHRRNICLKLGIKGAELVREAALQNLRGQRAHL